MENLEDGAEGEKKKSRVANAKYFSTSLAYISTQETGSKNSHSNFSSVWIWQKVINQRPEQRLA